MSYTLYINVVSKLHAFLKSLLMYITGMISGTQGGKTNKQNVQQSIENKPLEKDIVTQKHTYMYAGHSETVLVIGQLQHVWSCYRVEHHQDLDFTAGI